MGDKKLKKTIIILAIVVLFSTTGISKTLEQKDKNSFTYSGVIISVDDDGTADYINMQDAIDNVNDYDTIFVYSGTYNETISINKKIKLQGENREKTIIDGIYNKTIFMLKIQDKRV